MKARKIKEEDFNTINSWYKGWGWPILDRELLPNNGKEGLIISDNNIDLVAGFIWFTDSKMAFFGYVISNPIKLKKGQRDIAISTLISCAEELCKRVGVKVIVTSSSTKSLIKKHKELNWKSNVRSSFELQKILK
jgi:hypothetical protein